MAGVEDTQTIDIVARDADDTVVLSMVETRPWDGGSEQLTQLQDKVTTYLTFVRSGQLLKHDPEAVGQPVRVQLHCTDSPPPPVVAVLDQQRARLAATGIDFAVVDLNLPL